MNPLTQFKKNESYSFSSHRRWSPLNAFPELHPTFFPQVICTCENHQRKNHMKTITKLIYLAFTVVVLAIGAVTANGAPNDLFVSINGDGNNGHGFIYEYNPGGVQSIFASGLSRPRGVAFDHFGNLFVVTNTFDAVSGTFQPSIVKITPDGVQSIFATLSGNLSVRAWRLTAQAPYLSWPTMRTTRILPPQSTNLLPAGYRARLALCPAKVSPSPLTARAIFSRQ
jgi:hypothetical protein